MVIIMDKLTKQSLLRQQLHARLDLMLNRHLKEGLDQPELVTLTIETCKEVDEDRLAYQSYEIELGKLIDGGWSDLLYAGRYMVDNHDTNVVEDRKDTVFDSPIFDALGVKTEYNS